MSMLRLKPSINKLFTTATTKKRPFFIDKTSFLSIKHIHCKDFFTEYDEIHLKQYKITFHIFLKPIKQSI